MIRHLPALLFMIPFSVAVSLPLVGVRHRQWCHPLALGAVAAMSLVAGLNLGAVLTYGASRYAFGGWAAPIGIEWLNDELAAIIVLTLSLLTLTSLVFAGGTAPRTLGGRVVPFYTLILLQSSALAGVVFAADLFNVFVFLEVAALAGYALVGVSGGRALVSAFRYLILGSLGASLYLLGIGYLYAATGTLSMADLGGRVPELLTSPAIVGGLTFIFLGLAIKMAIMPMHGWLPDAYTYAPDAVSPFLAASVTKVAMIVWVRIMFWVIGPNASIEHIPVVTFLDELGAITAVAGALLALTQREIKRMFAYGGISHMGLVLMAVSLGNPTALAGGVFYLINDAVMQAALFFLAGAAIHQSGVRTLDELGEFRGPAWLTGALILVAMSMVGIPPTGGFFGKWNIILGAIEAGNYFAVGAVILSTLLTLGYFIRLFERLFTAQPETAPSHVTPPSLRISVAGVSAAIILLGVLSDPIVRVLLELALPDGM